MTIGKKSMAITSGIILFVVLIISSILYSNTRAAMITQAEEKALGVIRTFEATINDSSKSMTSADFEALLQRNLNDLKKGLPKVQDFTVYRLGNNPVSIASTTDANKGIKADPEDVKAATNNKTITIVSNKGNENVKVDVTTPITIQGKVKYVAGVTYSIKDEMHAISALLYKTIIVSSIAILVSLLLMWFFFIKKMSAQLSELKEITDEVAKGNLDLKLVRKSNDEIGILESNFNEMILVLRSLVSRIQTMSQSVTMLSAKIHESLNDTVVTVEDMAKSAGNIAEGNIKQSEALQRASKRVANVAFGLDKVSESIGRSEKITNETSNLITEGVGTIEEQKIKMEESKLTIKRTNQAILQLEKQSNEVSNITDVIKAITEQINLLALNAAIEAARAGEGGKGFSVVAEEVRKLAEQSKVSTEQIYALVNEIQSNTKNVVIEVAKSGNAIEEQEKVVLKTAEKFYGIENAVGKLSQNIDQISYESKSLNGEAESVRQYIVEIAQIAEESIKGTEMMSAGSEEQTSMVQELLDLVTSLTNMSKELNASTLRFKL